MYILINTFSVYFYLLFDRSLARLLAKQAKAKVGAAAAAAAN